MHPILIQIGDTPVIHTFGLMVLAGVLLAIWWIKRDAPRIGIDGEQAVSLAVEVFLAGLIGSRILFIAQNWDGMWPDAPISWINLRKGGLVWYGGLIAATPVAAWRARAYQMPVLKLCDLLAPATMLGLAIGRIGCLMAGDDHGKVWPEETWFTLTFTDPNALMEAQYRNKPLLPSQPLMTLGCLMIFGTLAALRKKIGRHPGALTALLFVVYPIHRYLIEMTRGDKVRGFLPESIPIIGGMSTSQAIGVPLVLGAIGLFVYFMTRPPVEHVPLEPKPEGEPAESKADAGAS